MRETRQNNQLETINNTLMANNINQLESKNHETTPNPFAGILTVQKAAASLGICSGSFRKIYAEILHQPPGSKFSYVLVSEFYDFIAKH